MRDIKGLMIDSGEIEILDMLRDDLSEILPLGCCDDCSDSMTCMGESVRWRVSGLLAASRLLIKMPPLPPMGSTMQSMSYFHVPS